VADTMKDLADALDEFDKPFKRIENAIELFAAQAPWFGVVGGVLGLANIFLPGGDSELLKAVKALSDQIDGFQTSADLQFDQVLQEVVSASCATSVREALSVIRQGQYYLALQGSDPSDRNKESLIKVCDNNYLCDRSVRDLIDIMMGESYGCDLLALTFDGTSQSHFFKGSVRVMQQQMGSLIMMISQGVAVQAAYKTLYYNDESEGTRVSENFKKSVSDVTNRWKDYLRQCREDTRQNVKRSAADWVATNYNKFDRTDAVVQAKTDEIAHLLTVHYPNHLFAVYFRIQGQEKY